MNSCLYISLFSLGFYFLISLPFTVINYSNRYSDYKFGDCLLKNSSINYKYPLYEFKTHISIKNCSQNLTICCNSFEFWNQYKNDNFTSCYFDNKCDIVPDFYINSNLTFFEISSFIIGVLIALNIIIICENKKKVREHNNYQQIN